MKYISFLFFAVLMSWTWGVVHSQDAVTFETHSGIQEAFANLITENVRFKKPSATEIVVERVWTETLAPRKVRASFIYSFRDGADPANNSKGILTRIQGEAVLDHQESSSNSDVELEDKWLLTKIRTSSDSIQFEEGSVIHPFSNEDTENPAPPSLAPEQNTAPAEQHQNENNH